MTRLGANLATVANGACGIAAVLYILAGNSRWAGLLIVAGVGFDGLDGILSRRAGLGPSTFGRVADSVSDSITFGVAPAALIAVHTANAGAWASFRLTADVVAGLLLVLALGRLSYFTLRAYRRSDFLGVPTPQTALAVVVLVIWGDVPGFLGVAPAAVLLGAAVASALMVAPIPYPKMRRGARLRGAMTVTALALVAAEIPLQFRPDPGSPLGILTIAGTAVATAGLLLYYIAGPFTVLPSTPPVGAADA